MGLEDLKTGDLMRLIRHNQHPNLNSVSVGIFLGSKSDLTPARMSSYIRIHMLELGGKIFSVIYWIEKDRVEKIE